MIEVREVLRRWQAQQSEREIARQTLVDRKTVHRYVETAIECGLPTDRALTDEEVGEVAQRIQSRPLPTASDQWSFLEQHGDAIRSWLTTKDPLTLRKAHILLERQGYAGSYDTLRRFAIKELGWGKSSATVLLDDPPPAQEAQMDFGRMGRIEHEGQQRMLWALIITLALSRYQFVWPLFRRTTEAVIEALEQAWLFFGGMPRTLVPDNDAALVVVADPLAPRLTEAFADYAQNRGLFVDPARVRRPKDKPRVERQVQHVRGNWFAGEQFRSLLDARQSACHWSAEIAGRRIHGTTRKVPREVYEQVEKPHMLPPPEQPYDVPIFGDPKVHPDHHIHIACALYSVPFPYVGKHVHVRADRNLVRIYDCGQMIKVHNRQPPGGRSTDQSDYPPGKSAYARRSIDDLLTKARARGEHIGIFAQRMLDCPLPWARMRSVQALLGLCNKYGEGRVEAVCQSALSFDVIDVARVGRMLKRAAVPPQTTAADGKVVQLPLSLPRFSRSAEHFQTRKGTKEA